MRAIVLIAAALSLHGQTFDVASVKALQVPFIERAPTVTPGRFTWTTDLIYLLGYAYRLQPFQLEGPIPGSNAKFVYRVDASFAPASTDEQIRRMLQALLVERFKIQSHRVNKDAYIHTLTVAKGGLKMKAAAPGEEAPAFPEAFGKNVPAAQSVEGRVLAIGDAKGATALAARRVTMAAFCASLSRQLQSPVIDATGLDGEYYFGVRYAREDRVGEVDAPPLSEALQKELGLKLERRRGPMVVLVIDRIESVPIEN